MKGDNKKENETVSNEWKMEEKIQWRNESNWKNEKKKEKEMNKN